MIHQDLSRRLPSCGPALCSHYAKVAETKGTKATTEDAFDAWRAWIKASGGEPVQPLSIEASRPFHERVAITIREVARYGRET